MAQAATPQIYAGCALFGMKPSRDSLPDGTGSFTTARVRLLRATEAGALYAVIVFLIGFILGTIRVLLLAPRLGETMAVILEVPFILSASWAVYRRCLDRLDVAATIPGSIIDGFGRVPGIDIG
jgi:hypothetical protein